MRNDSIVDLSECTDLKQTLAAHPPRIVHGTAALLAGLLAAAVAWAAVTEVDRIVKAPGKVRPMT